MARKSLAALVKGLLMGWLLACWAMPAAAAIDNKYGLILQSELSERFKREVEPYWEQQGRSGRFTGVGGVEIAYMTFIQPDEKGAVVISSGRTESYVKYKELIHDLGRLGYSVYIHDHRGQGFSQRLLPDPYKGHVEQFDDYVQDLDRFVRTVVLTRPHKTLFLLAHSMGGAIATRYIEQYPQVFAAAALSSPMHAPNAKILISAESSCLWFESTDLVCKDCYAGFVPKPYNPQPFEGNEYTHSSERYTIFRDAYRKDPQVQLGGPTRAWAAQACAETAILASDARRIRIPVLVLQAGADTAVTPEGQNEFCASLLKSTGHACYQNGPIRFEGARHELFIEADEYRIPALNTILDFFAERLQ
jgi:lysophospholipase